MSSLPGFSPCYPTKFSEIEFDKTFGESMQLLNENQKKTYYVFPSFSILCNQDGETMNWSSKNVLLYSYDHPEQEGSFYIDKDNLIYEYKDGELILDTSIDKVMDWDYSTTFIDAKLGNVYSRLHFLCSINITQTDGVLKIPQGFYLDGIDLYVYGLNCTLDISRFQTSSLYLSFNEPSNTGKVIMNSEQRNFFSSRIQEQDGVLWIDGKLKVEVSTT